MTEDVTSTTPGPVRARRKRIIGVDAARGLALAGMIAVHVLPMATDADEPTASWLVASGVSAALFSFMAGVSLALSSGGRTTLRGAALNGARAGIAVRAGVLVLLGLLLGLLNPPAGIILTYYGVMFLLALPLLGARPGALLGGAAAFALLGTVVQFSIAPGLPGLDEYDPSLLTLLTQPLSSLSAVLVTGSYPALAWMTFICAGLAVGRMDLGSLDLQLRLVVGGSLLAVVTWLVSLVAREVLGGFDRILYVTSDLTEDELIRSLTWGTDYSTPEITSGWWLFMLSPYSETPLEVLNTLGLAVLAFAILLLIGSRAGWLLTPLALVGTMTLTLYSAHLVVIDTGVLGSVPYLSFWLQLGAALLFVVLWRNIREQEQGPLERMSSRVAAWGRDRYLVRSSARRQEH